MDATTIKIGGSLALYPKKLRILCAKLSELSAKHKLIVVAGGGMFADAVRAVDKQFELSCATSHRMAILGMDQYGFLLSDLIPGSCVINQLAEVQKAFDLGKLPVFLPSNFFLSIDPLKNSWDVTSDSISVYIASKLQIERVILVTDVDGVYTCDPKKCSDAKLIKHISATQIGTIDQRTSVDKFLPELLLQLQIECFVVNGLYPERVEAILENRKTTCTVINGLAE